MFFFILSLSFLTSGFPLSFWGLQINLSANGVTKHWLGHDRA